MEDRREARQGIMAKPEPMSCVVVRHSPGHREVTGLQLHKEPVVTLHGGAHPAAAGWQLLACQAEGLGTCWTWQQRYQGEMHTWAGGVGTECPRESRGPTVVLGQSPEPKRPPALV